MLSRDDYKKIIPMGVDTGPRIVVLFADEGLSLFSSGSGQNKNLKPDPS